jgi:hypothetical protein
MKMNHTVDQGGEGMLRGSESCQGNSKRQEDTSLKGDSELRRGQESLRLDISGPSDTQRHFQDTHGNVTDLL